MARQARLSLLNKKETTCKQPPPLSHYLVRLWLLTLLLLGFHLPILSTHLVHLIITPKRLLSSPFPTFSLDLVLIRVSSMAEHHGQSMPHARIESNDIQKINEVVLSTLFYYIDGCWFLTMTLSAIAGDTSSLQMSFISSTRHGSTSLRIWQACPTWMSLLCFSICRIVMLQTLFM